MRYLRFEGPGAWRCSAISFWGNILRCDPARGEPVETSRQAHQVTAHSPRAGRGGHGGQHLAALGIRPIAGWASRETTQRWALRRDLTALGCDLTQLLTTPPA